MRSVWNLFSAAQGVADALLDLAKSIHGLKAAIEERTPSPQALAAPAAQEEAVGQDAPPAAAEGNGRRVKAARS